MVRNAGSTTVPQHLFPPLANTPAVSGICCTNQSTAPTPSSSRGLSPEATRVKEWSFPYSKISYPQLFLSELSTGDACVPDPTADHILSRSVVPWGRFGSSTPRGSAYCAEDGGRRRGYGPRGQVLGLERGTGRTLSVRGLKDRSFNLASEHVVAQVVWSARNGLIDSFDEVSASFSV